MKGTAKPKCQSTGTCTKEKETNCTSPRGISPTPNSEPPALLQQQPPSQPEHRETKDAPTSPDTALSLVTLTPPSSPDK